MDSGQLSNSDSNRGFYQEFILITITILFFCGVVFDSGELKEPAMGA